MIVHATSALWNFSTLIRMRMSTALPAAAASSIKIAWLSTSKLNYQWASFLSSALTLAARPHLMQKTTSRCSWTNKTLPSGRGLSGRWSCRPAIRDNISSAHRQIATTSWLEKTESKSHLGVQSVKLRIALDVKAPLGTKAWATWTGRSQQEQMKKKRNFWECKT